MKAIILAAGYATRLYPLTQTVPKPLIPVGGKPMIDHLLEKVAAIGVKEVIVVTNSKFADAFSEWAQDYMGPIDDIAILDDGTDSNETRLGGLGDLQFCIEAEQIDEDVIVLAGDNLFKFDLRSGIELMKKTGKAVNIAYDCKSLELAKQYGILSLDASGKITEFAEKPAQPKSTLASIAVYFYPKYILPLVKKYIQTGGNKDGPGHLIQWLVKTDTVYAVTQTQSWYDVGGFESLVAAKREYGEKDVDIDALKQGKI